MRKRHFLCGIVTALCMAVTTACKPPEPAKPDIRAETAEVEAKIQKLKATPTKATMEEVDRALAGMNAKIKELEARESQAIGAEKDKTASKLSALRTQYNLYKVEVAGVKAQTVTGRALEKARDVVEKAEDAMKKAADSVSDSLYSTNN
jgi:multidrug resistance efflux pump